MWGAIAGAVAGIGTSLIGANQAKQANKDARNRLHDAIAGYQGIETPSVEDQELMLEEFRLAGILTPELEQAVRQGETDFSGIVEDPRLKEAQMNALMQLQDISADGFTLADKAALDKVQMTQARDAKARNDAVMQKMAERGMTGSGMELANLLSNEQSSANIAAQQGTDVAALAQQRALEAILSGADLSGNMRTQDYNIQADKARAQDSINQFNASLLADSRSRNTDRMNNTAATNLQNRQNLMNNNTEIRNYEQQYNKELLQQKYNNDLKKQDGITGLQRDLADNSIKRGEQERQMWGQIGSGLVQSMGSGTGSGGAK